MRQFIFYVLTEPFHLFGYRYRQLGDSLVIDALPQTVAQAYCVVAGSFQQTGHCSVFDQCPRGERQVQVACVFFFQQGQVQLEIGVG